MALRFKSISEARRHLGDISFKEDGALRRTPVGNDLSANVAQIDNKPKNRTLSPPHQLLWDSVVQRYGDIEPVLELQDAVPGRRFRLDIAFPAHRLAIEVDGWQYHGKFKKGFIADRKKQNLLVENHWRVLRFTAGEIFNDIETVMQTINSAMNSKV
ncbi:hypothetical protein CL689_04005 [Candidatus Saccharibacteria bacterium]|nr:hypothetical protein [Candidatus Saccharibacteria bacterium]